MSVLGGSDLVKFGGGLADSEDSSDLGRILLLTLLSAECTR